MSELKKLQSLVRKNICFESQEEILTFHREIVNLISGCSYNNFPNLQEIFQPEEINRLLANMMKFYSRVGEIRPTPGNVIRFVAHSGYKDEPDLDQDDPPVTRRTTALHRAVRCDRWLISHLIDNESIWELFIIYHRLDVNYVDVDGLTHFHVACRFGCEDIVKKFLDLGADPNCRVTGTGYSTLHFALQVFPLANRRNVWTLLLKMGANPNLADAEGRSPLHFICKKFGEDHVLAKTLVELCDKKYRPLQIYAQDRLGDTPLSLAKTGGHNLVAELLLKSIADQNFTNDPDESLPAKKQRLE
ncbi:ankyrin repeat and protein kinase domain-containing protein 1-like [Trichogramma pretiosum]|uniref:ankyrin repeat and protein kinase domain-containing protein 1-like n=1 Tax=Trichogramma pretiosum TaxID=7493 RepID=UPI000C71B595|nr:ankyrin repeat and protein kinase domain-containing protein 1-like [Trichogramma pretiosum]